MADDKRIDDDRSGRRLIFSAAFVIVFCSSGPSAFSVFVDSLMQSTGASRPGVTLSLTMFQFCMGVAGIFSGRIVDRSGPRKLMYAGGVLLAIAWTLTAFASNLFMLYLGFGVFMGAGVGVIYNPAINTSLRWFPDKRGAMAGLLLGASSLGTLVMAKLAAVMCHHFGSRGLMSIGFIYLVLIWAVGWKMSLPEPGWKPAGWEPARPDPGAAGAGMAEDVTPSAMLRTGTFWFMLLLYGLAATAGIMMVSALSPMAQAQLGMAPIAAANMVSLNCLANFFGRLATGRLCDKWGDSKTLALIFVLTVISLLGLRQADSLPVFVGFLLVLGASFGGVLVVFPPLTARVFGITHSGANYGIMFFGYALGSLLGPQIAAHTVDPSLGAQAFGLSYLVASGVAVAGFVLSLIFIKKGK